MPLRLAGICMAAGGPTSHVAILAAAMGIPALVAMGPTVLALSDRTRVVLDAERGFPCGSTLTVRNWEPPKASSACGTSAGRQSKRRRNVKGRTADGHTNRSAG